MKTILIVQDNEKKLARDILRAKGYATLEAVNGLDGYSWRAHKPDLVLMDIQLPDINGMEGSTHRRPCRHGSCCRWWPSPRRSPLTTAAASAMPASTDFLGKPINLKEFVETMRRMLGEGAA